MFQIANLSCNKRL